MAKKGYQPGRKVRIRGITEKFIVAGLIFCCVIAFAFSFYMVLKSFGKSSLKRHAELVADTELSGQLNDGAFGSITASGEEAVELKEGQILVEGEVYQYNEDIMTFLCMGIDSRSGIIKEKTPGKAGQADAILLIVVNPHQEEINIIAINRDTMTNIEIYDTAGVYLGKEEQQITLQYAYGNGRETSCELMEKAVSDLFYGIPIHGYGALDMESIAALNDAVGGVEVTVLEDMTKFNWTWAEGKQITLTGQEALTYIRERDSQSGELGTNIKRIERQKQYLNAFANKLRIKTREDITFPLTVYNKIQKHVVSSLAMDEITYLADTLLGYDFSMQNIISLPGESGMGEKNEEFYIDEAGLKQVIINVFYEKTEP